MLLCKKTKQENHKKSEKRKGKGGAGSGIPIW
jgi:hypothetical protein